MATIAENQTDCAAMAHATAPDPQGFIGVFDSGLGGISVLQALVRDLPHERFVYYGDSANAPYGDKTEEQVRERSCQIAEQLIAEGAKAIVIACNTATSAAAASLRAAHPETPIIGIEPALKPAATSPDHGSILVMATRTTLDLDKFHALAREYGSDSIVYTQACPGLADAIEQGDLASPAIDDVLEKLLGKYADLRIESVVLGCTHYPFVKDHIARVLEGVRFFDGNEGTAHHLRRRLEQEGLCATSDQEGSVEFRSSRNTPEEIALYQQFYDYPVD